MRPYYSLSEHWALTQLTTGQPFFVDKRSRDITSWIVMAGYWETFVDDVLCALARPGDTFIDAGANMGYYTVKIGGLIGPTGRVFAFEPNPEMFAFVSENIHVNGQGGRDIAFNVALGDRPGRLQFCHDPAHPGGGLLLLEGEAAHFGRSVQSVPTARLDDLLPHGTRIDLVKIDVEGYEAPLFRGMVETLGRSPDAAIVCEVAAMHWARFGDPPTLLKACAGERLMFRIHSSGRLEAMDRDRLGDYIRYDRGVYVLMLPDTPERLAQLQALLDRFDPPKLVEPQPKPAPETAPVIVEPEPPPPPASVLRRIAQRLLR